jgi:H+-transporting ATPase
VTIIIAVVYYILTTIQWLDNLGRRTRSKADTQIENMIAHASKLTIEHETDYDDTFHYTLPTRDRVVEAHD